MQWFRYKTGSLGELAGPERLARQITAAVQALRRTDLYKRPGVAEALDWAEALLALGADHLDEPTARATLGAVLKYHEDQAQVELRLTEIVQASAGDAS